MNKKLNILLFTLIFNLFCILGISAEALTSPTWGYSLDLPEGFVLANREGNSRYLFQHSIQPVDLQIALYAKGEFSSPKQNAEHIFAQLKMKHKDKPFDWHYKKAYLSMIEFEYAPSEKYQKKRLAGWLLVLELPNDKGNLVMLTYTDADKAKTCEPLMISSLDTVFTDVNSYFIPGPVTTALYPERGKEEVNYKFNDKNIKFKMDISDPEANKSVVDREFQLLTIYLNRDNVFEAWKRYYQIIFRDAWSRIQSFTLALQMAYPELMSETGIAPEKATELLLKFVQNFKYIRDRKGSDFTNLPQAVLQKKGDCDARSLLLVLVLKQMNIDAVLLISPTKHHSIAAVDYGKEYFDKAQNDKTTNKHFFEHIGKNYIMTETTAHVEAGNLDDRLNDADWFVVDFFLDDFVKE